MEYSTNLKGKKPVSLRPVVKNRPGSKCNFVQGSPGLPRDERPKLGFRAPLFKVTTSEITDRDKPIWAPSTESPEFLFGNGGSG